jgi:pilus assembly protein CpaE
VTTSHLLVISSDGQLHEEMRAALRGVGSRAPAALFFADSRAGIEAARSRQPQVIVLEMTPDLAALRACAQEAAAAVPGAILVAAFRPEVLAGDVSESTLLIEAIRVGVKDFLRRPLSATELDPLLARAQQRAPLRPPRLGSVVSFISNKGGVGKSTLAVNSAVVLAHRHPERVLLIDASLQLGVAASLLDLAPAATLVDAVHERERLDETFLRQLTARHESGLHLLAAPPTAVEAAEVDDDALARVITLARRAYDLVVIDTFPLFDRVVLATLDLSSRAYLVTENVVPTLLGAAKLIELLAGLGFPAERQRIVVNRYAAVPGGLRPLDIANRLGRPVDFVLPFDKRLLVAANTGRPYALAPSKWWGFGPPLAALASDVELLLAGGSDPFLAVHETAPAASGAAEASEAANIAALGGRQGQALPAVRRSTEEVRP